MPCCRCQFIADSPIIYYHHLSVCQGPTVRTAVLDRMDFQTRWNHAYPMAFLVDLHTIVMLEATTLTHSPVDLLDPWKMPYANGKNVIHKHEYLRKEIEFEHQFLRRNHGAIEMVSWKLRFFYRRDGFGDRQGRPAELRRAAPLILNVFLETSIAVAR
jgi:hypothetical protein